MGAAGTARPRPHRTPMAWSRAPQTVVSPRSKKPLAGAAADHLTRFLITACSTWRWAAAASRLPAQLAPRMLHQSPVATGPCATADMVMIESATQRALLTPGSCQERSEGRGNPVGDDGDVAANLSGSGRLHPARPQPVAGPSHARTLWGCEFARGESRSGSSTCPPMGSSVAGERVGRGGFPARADRPPWPLQPVRPRLIDKSTGQRPGQSTSSGATGPIRRAMCAPPRAVRGITSPEGGALRWLGGAGRAPRGPPGHGWRSGGPPVASSSLLKLLWPGRPARRRCARFGWRTPRDRSGDRLPKGPPDCCRPTTARASDGHAAAGGPPCPPITRIRPQLEPLHRVLPAPPRRAGGRSAAVSGRQQAGGRRPAAAHLGVEYLEGTSAARSRVR